MASKEPDIYRSCEQYKGHPDVAWITVRKDGNYASVALRFDPEKQSGELLIHSSLGVYGRYWSHCGKPFPDFLTSISSGYLLSKISKSGLREDKALTEFKKTLLQHRRDDYITKETAREAYDTFPELLQGHGAAFAISHAVWAGWISSDYLPISKDYPEDDYQFVQELWPLVVQTIQEHLV